MTRRRRRVPGLFPWLAQAIGSGVRWCVRHPQLFFALGIMGVCSLGVWSLVTRSEAFAITEIHVPAQVALQVPGALIGQNLWSVDLNGLASSLKTQQPHLKRLRVIRRVPHTLQVEAVERTPVAQVKLSQWHLIDEEGFILPPGRPAPWENLVMLKGMEGVKPALRVGQENTDERVLSALRIVAQLARSSVLAHRQVVAVDVSNPQHVTAWIRPTSLGTIRLPSEKETMLVTHSTGSPQDRAEPPGETGEEIEVRYGSEDELATQLERLRAVLRTVEGKSLAIRYIDVRFKDPVIGPRT
ncbi:MAG: FtsQ-type POTRA domain-containing protein [Candidatus Omnitrophica bacterium]|nr:FtsQ-type POTRA domain-containing protein [Candidatus Omnitrophota bacterium]